MPKAKRDEHDLENQAKKCPLNSWDNSEWSESHSVMLDSLRLHGLYSPWNSPGQNTGVGSCSLLQGSSQPRDRTQVSCIEGRFFTNWAIRDNGEALEVLNRKMSRPHCCCSVTKSCTTLHDHMDCSRPGFPVPSHLPEFAQVYVHCIGDAIQPSHPVAFFSFCLQSFPDPTLMIYILFSHKKESNSDTGSNTYEPWKY